MARILFNDDWFEQLSTEALYEEEYERLLLKHRDSLFPNHILTKFKKTVFSSDSSAKADFALVHKRYCEWWVVEAEMSHHSFEQHVRPQVETLSRANYGEEEAHYLQSQEPRLDIQRMTSMVKGHPPGVLVVVNAPVSNWSKNLKQYGALVMIFEVFRSRLNRYLYRLNGEEIPEIKIQKSVCTVELARMLKLHSPGILPTVEGNLFLIWFRNGLTEWRRIDTKDSVYLTSAKPVSLDHRKRYELIELEDNSLVLNQLN